VRDTSRILALTVMTCLAGPVIAAQRDDLVANKFLPPEVGQIAPAIGNVRWLQVADEDKGEAPVIQSLRGAVVIVQTYGHYCDP